MLSAKQNFIETLEGGNPDRYVNNYEAFHLLMHPAGVAYPMPQPGKGPVVNGWGITNIWPEGTPGSFPIHDEEHLVLKDIEEWQEYVKAPSLDFDETTWDFWRQMYRDYDREKCLVASFVAPGVFEQSHHLASITELLVYTITNVEELQELYKYITEYELKMAEGICDNLKPDILFHHDDWGSESNSFLRPESFDELLLEPYKEIYGYYKSRGVKYIIHHSDSYAANLVPEMIEMGIDVWQGCMRSNNVPELIEKYGDKITFMGNMDNKMIDFEGFTREDCAKAVRQITEGDGLGFKGYVPCITQGGPGSTFPGAYMMAVEEMDRLNAEKFGFSVEDLQNARLEMQVMF